MGYDGSFAYVYSADELDDLIKESLYGMDARMTAVRSVFLDLDLNDTYHYGTGTLTIHKGVTDDSLGLATASIVYATYGGSDVRHLKAQFVSDDAIVDEDTGAWYRNGEWMEERPADYVVAQGTSGIWTYQKWNSGKIELWTESISHTVAFSTISSTLYLSNFTVTVPLVTKVIYANIQETAWHYAQWTTTTRNSTNQIVCRYYSANQNGNGKTYTFMAHVIGTWK